MNRINNYEQHIIRRREMLALTGLERGLVSGWEERSLWEYTGPSGKHRLYSRSDVVSMALAAELCRAGINARYAWDAVKQNIKHVLTGKIKYIVATPARHELPLGRHRDFRQIAPQYDRSFGPRGNYSGRWRDLPRGRRSH